MLTETRSLFAIALPLIAAYLAEMGMFLCTKILVGRLGYQEFAAVGLAGNVTFEILVVSMGLLSIVGVLAAQAEGAGRRREAGQAARQGLLVATLIGLPATLLVWQLASLFRLLGQDPVVVALAEPYLRALSGIVLPTLWFAVLRNFVAALARTRIVMLITLGAVGLNYLLTLGLVFGRFGLPALGVAGAGLSLSLVSWAMLLALLVYIYRQPALRGYGLFAGRLRIELTLCAEIFRLGIPVAGMVLLEAGLFVAVAVMSGMLGAANLAAFEILLSWIGVPFVVALGLAEATMVRVAYGIGRGSDGTARHAGLLGMGLGVMLVGAMIVLPLTFADTLTRVFVRVDDPGFAEVAALVGQLIVFVAVFQMFDGLQAIASRALRGLKDTVAPLWLAAFGYWVVGIGGGALLAFPLQLGARGLWWGLASGLIATGLLLAWRFERLSRWRLGMAVAAVDVAAPGAHE